jgi:hypothetical protein
MACSRITVTWNIPDGALPGTYRIRHMGSYRSLFTQRLVPYSGMSSEFELVAPPPPS